MSKSRKIKSQLIAAVMLITSMCNLMGSSVSAEEASMESTEIYTDWGENVTLFNADNYEIFNSRTMQDIANKYSEALYAAEGYKDSDPSTWYSEMPSFEYPYDPGMINEDTRETIMAMTNFYRWLMGLNPVAENIEKLEQLQTGAMIRNFDYNHFVRDEFKPEDMSAELWETGAKDGNNLLNNSTPQKAPTSWMNEGCKIFDIDLDTGVLMETEHITTIAHRSLLTAINLEEITYAHCGNVTSGFTKKDTGGTIFNESIPFVAYPCPGYMPSSLVNPQVCAWSFELNPNDLYIKDDDTSEIEISITNLRTFETITEPLLYRHASCLVFKQPTDYSLEGFGGTYGYVDSYKVEIEGLYASKTDLPAKISYTVNFFDMDDCRHTRVVSTETFRKYSIPGDMMNDEGFKYISSILPDEISVRADNGRYYSVPIKSRWSVDMERNCFVTSAEAYRLPSHVSDPGALMNEIVIPFEETNPSLAPYEWLQIDNSVNAVTTTGNDVLFHGQTCNVDIDTMEIFRLVDLPDDSCVSIKMFKTNEVEGGDASITLESAKPGDSGKYISVFYNQYYIDTFNVTKCFISNSLAELTVNTQCTCTTPSSGIHTNPISLGDVNLDKAVDLLDVLLLNKYIAGSVVFTEEQIANADVCKDSVILASDADALLKYTVEAIKSIPVMP